MTYATFRTMIERHIANTFDFDDKRAAIVWRILNPIDGSGPYFTPEKVDKATAAQRSARQRLHDAHQWSPNHPGWGVDGLQDGRPFGFTNPVKYVGWFSADQRRDLETAGFYLAVILARKTWAGRSGRQITFSKKEPLVLQVVRPTLDLELLLTMHREAQQALAVASG